MRPSCRGRFGRGRAEALDVGGDEGETRLELKLSRLASDRLEAIRNPAGWMRSVIDSSCLHST